MLLWLVLLVAASAPLPRGVAVGPGALQLHVALHGDDAGPGTLDAPLRTWEGANARLRTARKKGQPVDVLFHAGEHLIDSIRLDETTSGSEEAPVTFAAFQNATVHMVGGVRLSRWRPMGPQSPVWVSRLPPALVGPEALRFAELFLNHQPMTLARWPNTGWAHVLAAPGGRSFNRFWFSGTDNGWRWANGNGRYARVCGYLYWDFMFQCADIAHVALVPPGANFSHPEGAKGMVVAPEPSYGYRPGGRYFIANSELDLDSPGEYYIDVDAGVVYLWPPAGVDMSEAAVHVSVSAHALRVTNAQHIVLRQLEFHFFRDALVRIDGSHNVSLEGCVIANGGMDGLIIRNSSHCGAINCSIHSLGYGGVVLVGGDRRKLQPSNLFAVRNTIHTVARILRTYHPAIHIQGCGVQVRRNQIYNVPHAALELNGNNHAIDGNTFENVTFECGDCGALMASRSFSYLGNVISNNVFRNVQSPFTKEESARAIFLDDHASGFTIMGNTFYNCSDAILLGGGRQNRVIYNKFFDCDTCVFVSQRGLQPECMGNGSLSQDLDAFRWRQPPWATQYPDVGEAQDAYNFRKCSPLRNSIVANKCDVSCRRFCNVDLYNLHTWFTEYEDNMVDCEASRWAIPIVIVLIVVCLAAIVATAILTYLGQHHRILRTAGKLAHQLPPLPWQPSGMSASFKGI